MNKNNGVSYLLQNNLKYEDIFEEKKKLTMPIILTKFIELFNFLK